MGSDAPRALVVDDDPIALLILGQFLRGLRIPADAASGGGEAIRLLAEHAYALVISDLEMPAPDGISVLGSARARQPGALRILISSDSAAMERADLSGAFRLAKPIDFRRLAGIVELARRLDLLHRRYATSSDAMFVKNAEGRYLAMNGRSAALLKRSPEEVVGRLDSEVFDGATLLEEVRASDREAFRTCQPYVYANTTRVAGAAQTFLSVKLMFPAPVAAIACLSRDVTDLLTASPLHRRSGIDAILRDVAEFAAALERSRIDESLEPPPLGGRASAAARS